MTDKERKMYEFKIQLWRDVVKAQERLIKELNEVIELLKKAQT